MWIGFDDTDSRDGGCTTYVCFEFVSRLYEKGYYLCEYPRLVRLNPQVPWKTRGNGAVAVHVGRGGEDKTMFAKRGDKEFFIDPDASTGTVDEEEIQRILQAVLDEFAELDAEETNPGLVVSSTGFSASLYEQAVHDLVSMDKAVSFVDRENGSYTIWKNGRGVIGAAAAISWDSCRDHTYEIIAYRKQENWKTPRKVDDESVKKMDELFPSTFDNYDYHNEYNSIVPHSPCPILFGIRGDKAPVLSKCLEQVKSETGQGWMIFLSNQGTDDHIRKKMIDEVNAFQSVRIKGIVASVPSRKKGGHILFSLNDSSGSLIDCMAYEPTKEFRDIIETLVIGDSIEVYGGIRDEPLAVNIEKIHVWEVMMVSEKIENPVCPSCGKHMKSKGKGQGFFCKMCRTRSLDAIVEQKKRSIS